MCAWGFQEGSKSLSVKETRIVMMSVKRKIIVGLPNGKEEAEAPWKTVAPSYLDSIAKSGGL